MHSEPLSEDESGNQTKRSFKDKWISNPDFMLSQDVMERSGVLGWIRERNGFQDQESFNSWVRQKRRILDAGCGNGRVTSVLSKVASVGGIIVGADINSQTAQTNLNDRTNVEVVQADLLQDLSHLGQFDLIYCQEVLHHTGDPLLAFENLVKCLAPGGEIAIYVYKAKAPIREYTDDHVRSWVSGLLYEDAWEHMKAFAELGKKLRSLGVTVEVPSVPSLEIPEGKYDLHQFIYNFFVKCFWNESLSHDENVAINYDWYHPQIASRHHLDEVISWFTEADLRVLHTSVDDYGITVRGVLVTTEVPQT